MKKPYKFKGGYLNLMSLKTVNQISSQKHTAEKF